MNDEHKQVLKSVHDQYAAVARSGLSNDFDAVRAVAEAFGYTAEDLASLPAEANMGLSCGNPVAAASLKPGEVVIDLGCGGGLDVLLAAKKVGPTGKAIGIDMTADMLERARAGAEKVGAANVEFHLAQIDALPLPDNSVDCIISNCVINLVPDKDKAFREMIRVLRPGGRLSISDIALRQPLPAAVQESIAAYVGCIAGAILIEDYRRRLEVAGFQAVVIKDTGVDLNAYAKAGLAGSGCCTADDSGSLPQSGATSCCGIGEAPTKPLHEQMAELLSQFDANAYAASVRVYAVKQPKSVAKLATDGTYANVHIYDRAMCCSTGVCGPQVDPVLPRFAADLEWLSSQGHTVERYNLAQQPSEFIKNPVVQQLLASEGVECLPLIFVNDKLISRGTYPSREDLALSTGSVIPQHILRVVSNDGVCCDGGECC